MTEREGETNLVVSESETIAEPAQSLAKIIGSAIRKIRENLDLSQDEVARHCRAVGLGWSRSTLSAVEAGQKSLDVTEIILLANVLGVSVSSFFFANDEQVILTEGVTTSMADVRELLARSTSDSPKLRVTPRRNARWYEQRSERSERSSIDIRRYRRLAPNLSQPEIEEALRAPRGEAEQKAARRLGISTAELAVAAQGLWRRSLTEERELRFIDFDETMPLSVRRAHRAHVTRRLLEEVRKVIEAAGLQDFQPSLSMNDAISTDDQPAS